MIFWLLAFLVVVLLLVAGFYWYKKRKQQQQRRKRKNYRRKPFYTKENEETKAQRAAMEGTTKLNKPPYKIKLEDLLSERKFAVYQFMEDFKNRNYACLKVDSLVFEISENLTQAALQYLHQDMDIKDKNKDPQGNNFGYVDIPGIREYIKLRPKDPPDWWPQHPSHFESAFTAFHEKYSQISLKCFKILSEWVDVDEPEPQRLIRKEDYEIISKVLPERSSVSMIKYHQLKDPLEVCDEHCDTGILTFITRTHHPALEIWDRSEKKYVKIEELLEVGDIVVFVGEKVPLFSCSMRFPAAHHRVRMAEGSERLSIAYLLDVAN